MKAISYRLLFAGLTILLIGDGCGKQSVDPSTIVVNDKTITSTNGNINTIGGNTGNTGSSANAGGTSGAGGTTTGSGTTAAGGTNTGGTSGGSGTTTGSGTGTTTGGGTSTGGSSAVGTINANGDNGVPIGAVGTIVFKIEGKTYTLYNRPVNELAMCVIIPASPGIIPEPIVAINGTNINSGTSIGIQLGQQKTGVFDIDLMDVQYVGGEYNSMFGSGAKINFQTFKLGNNQIVTTKGTFDAILGKSSTNQGPEQIRVSGSFNLQ